MHELASNRQFSLRRLDAAMLIGGAALFSVVVLASVFLAADSKESLTRNTIRLSLGWYFAALCLMTRMGRHDWPAATLLGCAARWCWTWAVDCFLIHVAMAFHYYHHWSHANAFERTRQISGLGEGIYFSYLFALVWLADVVYWWFAPARYAARSIWIDRGLHTFMLFMVFNGMIIFESGAIRWAGIVMFVLLALEWGTRTARRCAPNPV